MPDPWAELAAAIAVIGYIELRVRRTVSEALSTLSRAAWGRRKPQGDRSPRSRADTLRRAADELERGPPD